MEALTKRKRRLSLSSIFFTFFVDNLSWSIVFPIFAPYFLDVNNKLFTPDIELGTRATILGVFLAIFPLGQFFGAPIMGEYADRVGRKKALLYTIFFAAIGLILSAISIGKGWLVLLFFSRLMTGIFSGNLSICLAAIVDLSADERSRVKHFGYLAGVAGFSFILGAFLGGKFSDNMISDWFNPAFPFWIGVFLTILNLLFVLFLFKETKEPDETVKFDFLESIHNVQKGFRIQRLKMIYVIYFLFLFAWNILLQFTPVIAIENFQFTNSEIGDMAAFMGVCWIVGAGYFGKVLIKRFNGFKILEFCLIAFTICCSLIVFPRHIGFLLFLVGLCVIFSAIAWPLCTNLISMRAGKEIQGKVLGISQSMQSLAMAISPMVGAVTYISMELPFIVAGLSSFLAGIFYFRLPK